MNTVAIIAKITTDQGYPCIEFWNGQAFDFPRDDAQQFKNYEAACAFARRHEGAFAILTDYCPNG